MENCGEPLAPCSPSWRIYNRFRLDFHTLKRYSQIETNERQGGSRYAEIFHKSAAVPHNPCPDFAGSFRPVLLPVLRHGTERDCRSLLPVRCADAVHWRVAGLHRLLPSGMGNQPLRTAGGGVLADGTGGRYKQYAESNLIAIHRPGTAAEEGLSYSVLLMDRKGKILYNW